MKNVSLHQWNSFLIPLLVLIMAASPLVAEIGNRDKNVITCNRMPKFYMSFSGREVISEGECFWDYMSCIKQTRDDNCCKVRFDDCCLGFHKHEPSDSFPSNSNIWEESVSLPEATTLVAPSTTTTKQEELTTTESRKMETTTTPIEETTTTATPRMEETSTKAPEVTTTNKAPQRESWSNSPSAENARPRIIDCVWQFNRCIQRKFNRREREDICYAIFEDCKMRSMGMRGPVTTDELPHPIPSQHIISSTSIKPTTQQEIDDTATLKPITVFPSVEPTHNPITTFQSDESTLEPLTTIPFDASTFQPLTTIQSDESTLHPLTTPPFHESTLSPTTTNIQDSTITLMTSTESVKPSTTLKNDEAITTDTPEDTTNPPQNLPLISTTIAEDIVETSTTPLFLLSTITETPVSNFVDSTLPTISSDFLLPTSSNMDDITTTDANIIGSTGQVEEEDVSSTTPGGPLDNLDSSTYRPPSVVDIITTGNSETIFAPPEAFNQITYNSVEAKDEAQPYSNTYECIWAFNGCVRRGESDDECKKSFRRCDNNRIGNLSSS